MDEYYERGTAFCDAAWAGLLDDVRFYVGEAQRAEPPVLELGCGTGRVLIPTAQAGVAVVGIDRSPAMLAAVRTKVSGLDSGVRERIEIVEGDMRDFSLGRRFGLITIPFRGFLHMLTQEDQRAALDCVREHLADDGRFILNIFDPRLDILARDSGTNATVMRKHDEFSHPETGNRVVGWDSRRYDPETQVLRQETIYDEVDGDGTVVRRTYAPLTLRWVYRYEMQLLLEVCGFEVEALYGDYQRGPFRYGAEQVWVARKRASASVG